MTQTITLYYKPVTVGGINTGYHHEYLVYDTMFARQAVIGPFNGVPTLQIRLANERTSQILSAEVQVSVLRFERTVEGEMYRRFYDLPLIRSRTPVFAMTFTVMHRIDEASPLWGTTPADMEREELEFLVTVTGLEEVTSQTVHARHSYDQSEIAWAHRFRDVVSRDGSGRRFIDYGGFHEIEPAA